MPFNRHPPVDSQAHKVPATATPNRRLHPRDKFHKVVSRRLTPPSDDDDDDDAAAVAQHDQPDHAACPPPPIRRGRRRTQIYDNVQSRSSSRDSVTCADPNIRLAALQQGKVRRATLQDADDAPRGHHVPAHTRFFAFCVVVGVILLVLVWQWRQSREDPSSAVVESDAPTEEGEMEWWKHDFELFKGEDVMEGWMHGDEGFADFEAFEGDG